MNYIYDVLLNFQNNYYEFFEWNKEDKITHIRKIPSFNISNKTLQQIKNNKVKISKDFLDIIQNKTEKFKKNSIEKIKYAAILNDNNEAIAIRLNKDGIINGKSSLQIDEQEIVIETYQENKQTNLNYQIIKQESHNDFQTRLEIENQKYLEKEIKNIYDNHDFQKLNYIYLECFGKNENDPNIEYQKLTEIIKNFDKKFHIILDFFKIIKQK